MARKKEQRQYKRQQTNILISVVMADDSSASLQSLIDISKGGLSFESEHVWESGRIICISFHPPLNFSVELLKIFGKIIWCTSSREGHFEVGVEFMNPTEAALKVIQDVESMYLQW